MRNKFDIKVFPTNIELYYDSIVNSASVPERFLCEAAKIRLNGKVPCSNKKYDCRECMRQSFEWLSFRDVNWGVIKEGAPVKVRNGINQTWQSGYVYAFNHNGMHFVCKRYAFDKAEHNLNDVYSFSSFKEVRLDFSQFEGSDIRVDRFEYNNILEDKN